MNLQRRDEIRAIAEFPNDTHWAQEMRRAVAELLAHIDTLESMRSRLCDALGLPADSAPETVAEAVEARRVVVPELTEDDENKARRDWQRNSQLGTIRFGYDLAASRARSVPADRVLGEGIVAVEREEWAATQDLLAQARCAAHAVEDDGQCDMTGICRAVFACDSLRANQGANNAN